MGCDAYADENGEFEILIRSYDNSQDLDRVKISGLYPKERLITDLIKGDWR